MNWWSFHRQLKGNRQQSPSPLSRGTAGQTASWRAESPPERSSECFPRWTAGAPTSDDPCLWSNPDRPAVQKTRKKHRVNETQARSSFPGDRKKAVCVCVCVCVCVGPSQMVHSVWRTSLGLHLSMKAKGGPFVILWSNVTLNTALFLKTGSFSNSPRVKPLSDPFSWSPKILRSTRK